MRNRGLAIGLGWLAAILLWWPGTSDAATYQLQVASIPDRVFMYFVEGRMLPHIQAFLDDKRRSKFLLFRDRQPQPLEPMVPEQSATFPLNVTFPKPNDPWGAATWNGDAGQLAVFRIRGKQSNYQKLKRVAVQTDGVHYPVSGSQHSVFPVAADAGAGDGGELSGARPGKRYVCRLDRTAGGVLRRIVGDCRTTS